MASLDRSGAWVPASPGSVEIGEPDVGELRAVCDAGPYVVDFQLWVLGQHRVDCPSFGEVTKNQRHPGNDRAASANTTSNRSPAD